MATNNTDDAAFEAAQDRYVQRVNDHYAAVDAELDEQEAMQ